MLRLLCGAFALALLTTVAGAADDGVELKDYKPKVGDRVRVSDEDRSTTRAIVTTDGKREDKIEKRTKVVVYVSETLAVKQG